MGSFASFCCGVVFLYWPYLWCRFRKEEPENYGLKWEFSFRAFCDVSMLSAAVLALLTIIAVNWPWEDLPRHRSLRDVLELGASGLAAAIIEETFFRGWMQPLLTRRLSPAGAIILTNLLFAPLHLIVSPHLISLCTFFPGLIMGWLKYRYKNLFPPTLFHLLGNIWSIWFFPAPINIKL